MVVIGGQGVNSSAAKVLSHKTVKFWPSNFFAENKNNNNNNEVRTSYANFNYSLRHYVIVG